MVEKIGKLWVLWGGHGNGHEPDVDWRGYWHIFDREPSSDARPIESWISDVVRDSPMEAAEDGRREGVKRAREKQVET